MRILRNALSGLFFAALAAVPIAAHADTASDTAEAAAARPLFQLPFPCGQKWEGKTYNGHDPNTNSLDMYHVDGETAGSTIIASAGGRVRRAEYQPEGAGWLVSIVDDDTGWGTSYMHLMEKPLVERGQHVETGTVLGKVGKTGNSGGVYHLHYQQWNNSHPDNTVESYFNGVPANVTVGHSATFTSQNCGTTPPPAATYRFGASGATFDGRFYSFFRRADNQVIQHVHTPNVGWTQPGLGGSMVSPPATIVHRSDLWVFGRRSDGQMAYRILSDDAWGNWLYLPGAVSGSAGLGVLNERMFVVAREGASLKYRFYDVDTGWNASGTWLGLGQPGSGVDVVTDPVTAVFDGRMAVLVRGSDGNVWLRWARGDSSAPEWSNWTKLTGAAAGNPDTAVVDNTLMVFVRTPGGEIRYHTYVKGASSWTLYRGLGSSPEGAFVGSPAAISFSDLLTVYARNDAGQMLYRTFNGAWSAWLQLGRPGTVNLDSSPVTMRNGATRIVAARAANDQIYTRSYSPSAGWSSWTLHPGSHAAMP